MISVYVRTRGLERGRDYRYFPAEPTFDWMNDPLNAFCQVERPTLIVRQRDRHVYARATGIPSSRTDEVGTPIRFTVALEVDGSSTDRTAILSFVAAWLADGLTELGAALDRMDVENWFRRPGIYDANHRTLFSAVRRVQMPSLDTSDGEDALLRIGGAETESNRLELLLSLQRLLGAEEDGFGAVVNLVDDPKDVAHLAAPGERGLLLVSGRRSSIQTRKPQPADIAAQVEPEPEKGRGPSRPLLGVMALVGILVLCLAYFALQ